MQAPVGYNEKHEVSDSRRCWRGTRGANAVAGCELEIEVKPEDVVAVDIDAKFGPLGRVFGLLHGPLDGLHDGIVVMVLDGLLLRGALSLRKRENQKLRETGGPRCKRHVENGL